jgi:hypothetical protein
MTLLSRSKEAVKQGGFKGQVGVSSPSSAVTPNRTPLTLENLHSTEVTAISLATARVGAKPQDATQIWHRNGA